MGSMKLLIHQLATQSGIPAKTIRYYESIGLLPSPPRARNNYRLYSLRTIERLRFIAGARSLGFHLKEIGALMEARDHRALVCGQALDSLEQHLAEIDRRIADLLEARQMLIELRDRGRDLPRNQKCDGSCIQYHIIADRARDEFTITKEQLTNE